jgi:hypothetical protein
LRKTKAEKGMKLGGVSTLNRVVNKDLSNEWGHLSREQKEVIEVLGRAKTLGAVIYISIVRDPLYNSNNVDKYKIESKNGHICLSSKEKHC